MSFDPHTTHKPQATTQAGSATLTVHDKQYEFPVISGTSGLHVIDITKLHGLSGAFTYDPGFASTASCKSDITFTDGNRGVLLYRGYPIEQLAEHGTYLETCHILLYGDLPDKQRYLDFKNRVTSYTMLHEQMHRFFSGYRRDAHPMAVMIGSVGALSAFYHDSTDITDPAQRELAAIRMIAKMPTIAAMAYKYSIGQPFMVPRNDLDYASNFLYMMFGVPCEAYKVNPVRRSLRRPPKGRGGRRREGGGHEGGLAFGRQRRRALRAADHQALFQTLDHRAQFSRQQGSAFRHGHERAEDRRSATPRPPPAPQRLRHFAADALGRRRRKPWNGPATENKHRQASRPFPVPARLPALRPDPQHAGREIEAPRRAIPGTPKPKPCFLRRFRARLK